MNVLLPSSFLHDVSFVLRRCWCFQSIWADEQLRLLSSTHRTVRFELAEWMGFLSHGDARSQADASNEAKRGERHGSIQSRELRQIPKQYQSGGFCERWYPQSG